jgi:hypothetical protein
MSHLGTVQLRRLAEAVTGRDFSTAWNEDILEGAPEIMLLSLGDINEALGTDKTACSILAFGHIPIAWEGDAVLTPGDGLPTVEEQWEQARLAVEAAEAEVEQEASGETEA